MPDSPKRKLRRRVMRQFKINEISLVDEPAQEPARISLAKRQYGGRDKMGDDKDQNKDVKTDNADNKVDKDTQKTIDGMNEQLKAMQKEHERMARIVGLTSEDREYFDTIKEQKDQDAFLQKSLADRKLEREDAQKKANDDDPVVYTTKDGVELRKSDGMAVVALSKANDAHIEKIEKLESNLERQKYEKRAEEELANLPGTISERAAMLKAIEDMPDDKQREVALNALKASNEALAKNFDTMGVDGGEPDPESAEGKLEKLTKERMAKNPKESFAVAQAEVLKTSEGREIYDEIVSGGNQ